MKPDIIVLAVKLLSKICDTGFTEFLSFICNSEFIKNLQLYVINLAVQHESKQNMNSSYYQDMNSFWSSLINLFNNILLLLPNTACSRLYEIVHACNISIQTPNNQAKIYPKILKEFDDFIKKFNYTFEEHQRKKVFSKIPLYIFEIFTVILIFQYFRNKLKKRTILIMKNHLKIFAHQVFILIPQTYFQMKSHFYDLILKKVPMLVQNITQMCSLDY